MTKKMTVQLGFDHIPGTFSELAEKPNGERVVAYLSDFKGQRYFSIRTIYKDKNDVWMPGKGLAVPADLKEALCKGLGRLIAKSNVTEMKRLGKDLLKRAVEDRPLH